MWDVTYLLEIKIIFLFLKNQLHLFEIISKNNFLKQCFFKDFFKLFMKSMSDALLIICHLPR